jgi:2-dehydro-3-deoxygluconokinase
MTTIGINTLVYMNELNSGTPQSAILPVIAGHGITLAEVRREYIKDSAEFDAIAAAGQANGLTLFYSVPESIAISGAVNPGFVGFLDEARRMGVSNIKFNQGDVRSVDAPVIEQIDAQAAAYGVTLTIENDQTPENGTLECTVNSLDHIGQLGGSIGYTFDLGNWFWRGENAEAAFAQLLPAISVFHLKNVNGAAKREELSTTMLEDGVIDWQAMLPRLDPKVPVFLEFPIEADRVAQQIAIVRAVVDARAGSGNMCEVMTIGEPMVNLIADSTETFMEARTLPRQMAGAEFNVAIGVKRQGHCVSYVTQLGSDWQGDLIVDYMRNAGIDTSNIRRVTNASTGYQLKVRSSDGEPKVIYFRAGSAASLTRPEIVANIDFTGTKILHVTGIFSALTPETYETVDRLVDAAHEQGVLVTFDPNPRPTLWPSQSAMIEATNKLAAKADVFMPGMSEGRLFSGLDEPRDIADYYLDRGVGKVIIKLGDTGSVLFERSAEGDRKETIEPSFVVEVVDTVGAGDGFASGVITGLLEGLDDRRLLERANAVGAIQVTSVSDSEGLPSVQELAEFIARTPRKQVQL